MPRSTSSDSPAHASPILSAVCAAAAVLAFSAFVGSRVNAAVPLPYMDELFHVSQTAAYCAGRWHEWDAGITTPPGLYLVAVGWSAVTGSCTTTALRVLNWVILAGVAALCVDIVWVLNPAATSPTSTHTSSVVLRALCVATLPVLWFSSLLFYTDVGSLFWVLLCYRLVLPRCPRLWSAPTTERCMPAASAVAGAVSLSFRQTNVVWVAFAAGTLALQYINDVHARKATAVVSPGWDANPSVGHESGALRFPLSLPTTLRLAWRDRRALSRLLFPHTVPFMLFVGFVVQNGGQIVLGDAEHHRPVFHAMQLFYWVLFVAPAAAAAVLRACRSPSVSAMMWIAVAAVLLCLVRDAITFEHPFLLADNRHITFYLWRRVLGRPVVATALAPIQCLLAAAFSRAVAYRYGWLWTTAFIIASAATMVPSQLFEPRYQIIPSALLLLHLPRQSVAVTLGAHITVCAATAWLFLYKPFMAPDGTEGRFMW